MPFVNPDGTVLAAPCKRLRARERGDAPPARHRARHGTKFESTGGHRNAQDDERVMASKPHPPFPPQDLEQPGLESRMDPQPRYQAEGYRPAGKLEGKAALVTGGDSGIGRAVAISFAREGADMGLVYLRQDDASSTWRRSKAGLAAAKCSPYPPPRFPARA
jgi:hypothetical protein